VIDVGTLVRVVRSSPRCGNLKGKRGIIIGREWGPVTSGPTFPKWAGYYMISFKGKIRRVHKRFVRVDPMEVYCN